VRDLRWRVKEWFRERREMTGLAREVLCGVREEAREGRDLESVARDPTRDQCGVLRRAREALGGQREALLAMRARL